MALRSAHFEVFGRVQGVFFRKYTEKVCKEKSVVGWVRNTPHNTVVGVIQGETSSVQQIKEWLSKVGSPKSRIDRCVFSREKTIPKLEYSSFAIRR